MTLFAPKCLVKITVCQSVQNLCKRIKCSLLNSQKWLHIIRDVICVRLRKHETTISWRWIVTGSICAQRIRRRRHLNYSWEILRCFAMRGRHVASMGCSTPPRQISLHQCNASCRGGGVGPQNWQFYGLSEYKRFAGTYPLSDFYKTFSIYRQFLHRLTT